MNETETIIPPKKNNKPVIITGLIGILAILILIVALNPMRQAPTGNAIITTTIAKTTTTTNTNAAATTGTCLHPQLEQCTTGCSDQTCISKCGTAYCGTTSGTRTIPNSVCIIGDEFLNNMRDQEQANRIRNCATTNPAEYRLCLLPDADLGGIPDQEMTNCYNTYINCVPSSGVNCEQNHQNCITNRLTQIHPGIITLRNTTGNITTTGNSTRNITRNGTATNGTNTDDIMYSWMGYYAQCISVTVNPNFNFNSVTPVQANAMMKYMNSIAQACSDWAWGKLLGVPGGGQ